VQGDQGATPRYCRRFAPSRVMTAEFRGKGPEIGMAFGGRDHSTVMHACEKVLSLRDEDPIFNEDYKNLQRLLQS
jgi:hypothetical protein